MGTRCDRRDFVGLTDGFRILDFRFSITEIFSYMPKKSNIMGMKSVNNVSLQRETDFGEQGKSHCGLLSEENSKNLLDFDMLSTDVVYHRNDSNAENCLSIARRLLNLNGRVVAFDPCLSAGQGLTARFLGLRYQG